MIGFAQLFIIKDLANMGMTADTTGPGLNRNFPSIAVSKLTMTWGRKVRINTTLTTKAIFVNLLIECCGSRAGGLAP